MNKRILTYILLVIIFLHKPLFSNGISVESKVDKAKITIGDLVKYTLIVRHDEDVILEDMAAGTNLGMFEVRDYAVQEPRKENGQVVEQYDFVISTFDVGDFFIPPLTLRYTTVEDSTVKEIKTEKIKIVVESVKPSEAGDIRDVKPPVEIPANYRRIIFISSVVFVVLLIAILLFIFIKRYREGKSLIPMRAKPPRPPHEVALEALEKLLAEKLLEQGKVKEFYIEISGIVRRYIEGRYHIVALEMTTYQLLENMRQANIDQSYIDMMTEFLELCDLVKFAKYVSGENENKRTIQLAFDFVNRTKLVLESTEESTKDKQTEIEKNAESGDKSSSALSEPIAEGEVIEK